MQPRFFARSKITLALVLASGLALSPAIVYADNVLSEISLTTSNTVVKSFYTNQDYLGDAAYESSSLADARAFLTATTTSATSGGDNTNLYHYATIAFPVVTSGTYTFGIKSANWDPFILVYAGAFNPNSMATNIFTANDDSGDGGGWNSGATIPPGVTLEGCPSTRQCPVLETSLSSGQTYTLFVSHYGYYSAEDFSLPIGIFVYGPSGVIFVPTGVRVYDSALAEHNNPGLGAAQVIDANSGLLEVFAGAGLVGDAPISNAVSQTLPLLTGGSMLAVKGALSGIHRVIQARMESNRGMSSGDELTGDKYFWVKPFGSWADQNDMNGVSGFKANTSGLAVGVDNAVSEKIRLGVAFAYANSDVSSNSTVAPQSADVNIYQLVGYGSYALNEDTELNFQVDAGQNTNKGHRTIAFTSTVADSDYSSWAAHAGLGLAKSFKLSDTTTFTPAIRADYTWMKDQSYNETGAGLLNLNVDSRSSEELVLGVDGKVTHALNDNTTLTMNLGVGYDVINDKSSITAAFAGAPTSSFVTYGLDPNPWVSHAGVGLVHTLKTGTKITASYDAEFRDGFLSQTAAIKARWAF